MLARGDRDPYYDGIRAVAILTVIAFHWLPEYIGHFEGGYIGVDVFFVLSGFIITSILWRSRSGPDVGTDYRRFLKRRVTRLYPALIGLVLGTIPLVWIFHEPVRLGEAVESGGLALVQGTSFVQAAGSTHVAPFGHTWSLAVEWMFYLLWPIALLHARRRGVPAPRLAAWAAGVAVVCAVASLPTTAEWFYFGPTSRYAQLLAGCALALAASDPEGWRRMTQPWLRAAWLPTLLATVALVFLGVWTVLGQHYLEASYRWAAFPIGTIAAVVLCALPLVRAESPVVKLLSLPVAAFIGRISYSLYLWHLTALDVLDKDKLSVPMYALGAIAVFGTIAVTLLSYQLLEKPFMKPRRSALRAPSVEAAEPSPSAAQT